MIALKRPLLGTDPCNTPVPYLYFSISTGIALVNGIVARKPIKVDAAFVADGVAGDEAAHVGVVEAVAEQVVAGVLMVVAVLTAEADGVVVGREAEATVGIVETALAERIIE